MKGRSRETKGQKSTGGGRTGCRKQEIVTPLSPPHPLSEEDVRQREVNLYEGGLTHLFTQVWAPTACCFQ